MESLDLRLLIEIAVALAAGAAFVAQARHARHQRRELEQTLRALDVLPARVIVADRDLNVSRVNDAARRGGAVDLPGSPLASVFQDPHALRRILAAPQGRAHLEPVSIGGNDAVMRLRILRDPELEPTGAIATWATVSETRDQQQSSLRSTLDRIPFNAVLADADGSVTHVNRPGVQALRSLFPNRSTEWIGRPVADVFGSPVRLSAEDEHLQLGVGGERLEVSTLPLSGSHVVTSGWLVLWRVATRDTARGETIDRTVHELSAATEQLTVAAVQLIANSDTASDRATRMLERTREVTDNTHSVANATEEMSGTINEISIHTRELAEGIARAVESVSSSKEIADGLRGAGREISRVSETISSIADQTNLLALNATIEAAGAGEAGRGFAVVANEVKELAHETMNATGAIDRQVQAMLKRSEEVAAAVGEVAEIVQGVSGLAITLAAAIEQQSTTTNEIASSVSYAAASAHEIGVDMETLFEAARSSNQTAESIRSAAEQLNEMARALDDTRAHELPRA